jgi:hypothetical protein
MKEQIVLTFLDVPNGKEQLIKVPQDIAGPVQMAQFISAGLDHNPTWVLTCITIR